MYYVSLYRKAKNVEMRTMHSPITLALMSFSCASGAVMKMLTGLQTGTGQSPSPQQHTLAGSITRNVSGLAAQTHQQTHSLTYLLAALNSLRLTCVNPLRIQVMGGKLQCFCCCFSLSYNCKSHRIIS